MERNYAVIGMHGISCVEREAKNILELVEELTCTTSLGFVRLKLSID